MQIRFKNAFLHSAYLYVDTNFLSILTECAREFCSRFLFSRALLYCYLCVCIPIITLYVNCTARLQYYNTILYVRYCTEYNTRQSLPRIANFDLSVYLSAITKERVACSRQPTNVVNITINV